MADVNTITITGRLTRDAEVKTLQSGTTLVTFDVANNSGFGDYAKTLFFTVNLWGKAGLGIRSWLLKGQLVGLTGTYEQQSWVDGNGAKHVKNVINSSQTCLLGSKHDEGGDSCEACKLPQQSKYDDYGNKRDVDAARLQSFETEKDISF